MNLSSISLNIYSFGYAAGFLQDPNRRKPLLGLDGLVNCALNHRLGGVEFPFDRYFAAQDIDIGLSVVKAIQDRGLRVFLDLELMSISYLKLLLPKLREVDLNIVRIKMDQVGRTFYGGNRYLSKDFVTQIERFKSQLQEIFTLLQATGVELAIENHQDLHSVELASICSASHGALGLTWDVGNSVAVLDTPDSFQAVAGALIRNVHLKDYIFAPTKRGFRLTRCPLGEGSIDFRKILKGLQHNSNLSNMSIELGAQYSRECHTKMAEYWIPYRDLTFCKDEFLDYINLRQFDGSAPHSAFEDGYDEDQIIASEFEQIDLSVANLGSMFKEMENA